MSIFMERRPFLKKQTEVYSERSLLRRPLFILQQGGFPEPVRIGINRFGVGIRVRENRKKRGNVIKPLRRTDAVDILGGKVKDLLEDPQFLAASPDQDPAAHQVSHQVRVRRKRVLPAFQVKLLAPHPLGLVPGGHQRALHEDLSVPVRKGGYGKWRKALRRFDESEVDPREEIGYYDPMKSPADIKIDNEKAIQWMKNGAQPTDTVRVLLKKSGAIQD